MRTARPGAAAPRWPRPVKVAKKGGFLALGVGVVEAALEGPGVGGRRADALGSGPVARAGRRRRRPGPPPPRILGAVAGRFT